MRSIQDDNMNRVCCLHCEETPSTPGNTRGGGGGCGGDGGGVGRIRPAPLPAAGPPGRDARFKGSRGCLENKGLVGSIVPNGLCRAGGWRRLGADS